MASTQHQRFNTRGGRAFDAVNIVVLVVVGLLALLPFLYVLAGSFATEYEIATRPFFLWPNEFSTDSYASILSSS
jgi:putative aldouronate transport system permease protein